MKKHDIEIFNMINELIKNEKEFTLATIIDASEGSPGRTGFKMILHDDKIYGTLGGGELELRSSEEMRNCIRNKVSKKLKYDLGDLNMACGGRVEIFIEYFPANNSAWLFGGGHMALALSPILLSLGFKVNVIDNREEYADSRRFNKDIKVIHSDYLDFASKFTPKDNDSVIIFTHGHQYDYDILKIITKRDLKLKYFGLIGAKNKVKKLKAEIQALNYGELIKNLHAPIGLNIARRTTNEIAVAIAAEIIAVYNNISEIKKMSNF